MPVFLLLGCRDLASGSRAKGVSSDELREMTLTGADNVGRKYVFRGAKPGRPLSNMAMLELIRRMNAEREVAGLAKWTDPKQGNSDVVPHGFRSSFRDWAAERTNFPREVAEAALAHIDGDETERAYQRGDLFEKRRRLMTAWADYCAAKASAVASNVRALRTQCLS